MPELPEVERTTQGLQKTVIGKTVKTCWSNYASDRYQNKSEIKNSIFFERFKKKICGSKIISAERRGKNILITLNNNQTIHIHLKMTGHLLYGTYSFSEKDHIWVATEAGPLSDDPFNQYIHFVITFIDDSSLVMSDMRKFAKITLFKTSETEEHLKGLGPEPFDPAVTSEIFREQLNKKPNWNIKTALMNQELIVGVGNIYSDEALFLSKVHPETKVHNIPKPKFISLLKYTRQVMKEGVDLRDTSRSDYRRLDGTTARFTEPNNVYRRTGNVCPRERCVGIIKRKVVNGRAGHFCPVCQEIPKA